MILINSPKNRFGMVFVLLRNKNTRQNDKNTQIVRSIYTTEMNPENLVGKYDAKCQMIDFQKNSPT